MHAQATITCECGCIFEVEFQGSSYESAPKCPQCAKVMDSTSWTALRDVLGSLADFNQHMVKYSSEQNQPRMMVPVVTVRTLG